MMPVLASHDNDSIINTTAALLVKDDWNDMQHDILSHLTLLALTSPSNGSNAIVNSTTAFIGSNDWNNVQYNLYQHVVLWCWCQCHIMPVSLKAAYHLLGQDDQKEIQHHFLVMWCHCHQNKYQVTSIASSMKLLHSFHQVNKTEGKHYHRYRYHMMHMAKKQQHHIPWVKIIEARCNMTFWFLMPLVMASVSHHVNSIITGTTASLKVKQLKWGEMYFFVMWGHYHQHWHHIRQLALVLLSSNATDSSSLDSTFNGTTAHHRSKQLKWGATWLCDTFMPFALA